MQALEGCCLRFLIVAPKALHRNSLEINFKLCAFQTPRKIFHKQISFFKINSSHAGNFPLHLNFDIFCLLCVVENATWQWVIKTKFSMANQNWKQSWGGKTLITSKETKTLAASVVLRLSDLTPQSADSFSHHKIVIFARIWPSYL